MARALASSTRQTGSEQERPVRLHHGTTVGTNALLERRLARTVFITNEGFTDLLALRRQDRPDLYALHPRRSPSLVPASRCVPVRGRMGPDGGVITPLEPLDAWLQTHRARLASADAFAICLLHSYRDPRWEQAIAARLAAAFPDHPVCCSAELAPVHREYERATTAVINAGLIPLMGHYLSALRTRVDRLAVMGSGGGLLPLERVTRRPVETVLSGPAGGVRGAWEAARALGRSAILSFDMGGTSTDVAAVSGELLSEDEGRCAGWPLRIELLPIETVGAGGGSIAHLDEAGVLAVGPRSAGAVPGPAAYGRAGPDAEPTVTDAYVALGRIDQLLGGSAELDVTAAQAALDRLADRLGLEGEPEPRRRRLAEAIISLAEARMGRACQRVTMERGIDPRGLSLVAFGGAGGLSACAMAEQLGCPEVIFPHEPGVLSARGMLTAPEEGSARRTLLWQEQDFSLPSWSRLLAALEAEAAHGLEAPALQRTARLRYRGQSYDLQVVIDGPLDWDALRACFDALHQQRYGWALPQRGPSARGLELVSLQVVARTRPAGPARAVPRETGETRLGPAIVRCYSATLWVPAGWRAQRWSDGSWICRREETGAARGDAVIAQRAKGTRAGGDAIWRHAELSLALEIHRQQLASIAEEMGGALMRSAFSPNIKERRDFSCAVFDHEGALLAHAAHIPVHLGASPLAMRAVLAAAAAGRLPVRPDGHIILNDPYEGGTHLPDITLITPVFAHPGDAAPRFWVLNRAHHADIGGIAAGSLPSPRGPDGRPRRLTIEDEGFRTGPVLFDEEVLARLCALSRTPDERRGDIAAQIAANRVGSERLRDLLRRLPAARLDQLHEALLDDGERRARAVLQRLPHGVWHNTDRLDDDGFSEEPVPLPVTLRLDHSGMTVDLRAAPPSSPGPLNAVAAIALSVSLYWLRCLATSDHEALPLPANAGLLRPLRVLTTPGTLLDPLPPAAVSAGNVETSMRLVDALGGALCAAARGADALVLPAASGGSMNNVLFGGVGPDGPFVHYETLAVGAGASTLGPGEDGVHTHMTNTLNTPVEALEQAFPVRIERYELRPAAPLDTRWHRGGRGVIRRYRFLVPVQLTLMTERRSQAPWGLEGAPPGSMGRNLRIAADGTTSELPGKVTLQLEAGACVEIQTPGGGSAPGS